MRASKDIARNAEAKCEHSKDYYSLPVNDQFGQPFNLTYPEWLLAKPEFLGRRLRYVLVTVSLRKRANLADCDMVPVRDCNHCRNVQNGHTSEASQGLTR